MWRYTTSRSVTKRRTLPVRRRLLAIRFQSFRSFAFCLVFARHFQAREKPFVIFIPPTPFKFSSIYSGGREYRTGRSHGTVANPIVLPRPKPSDRYAKHTPDAWDRNLILPVRFSSKFLSIEPIPRTSPAIRVKKTKERATSLIIGLSKANIFHTAKAATIMITITTAPPIAVPCIPMYAARPAPSRVQAITRLFIHDIATPHRTNASAAPTIIRFQRREWDFLSSCLSSFNARQEKGGEPCDSPIRNQCTAAAGADHFEAIEPRARLGPHFTRTRELPSTFREWSSPVAWPAGHLGLPCVAGRFRGTQKLPQLS